MVLTFDRIVMEANATNSGTVTTLFIGFGAASEVAAKRLLRSGLPATALRVIAIEPDRISAAQAMGLATEAAAHPLTISGKVDPALNRIIVEIDESARADAVVRNCRTEWRAAQILAIAKEPAAVRSLVESGASNAFCQATLAGHLLASTVIDANASGLRQLH